MLTPAHQGIGPWGCEALQGSGCGRARAVCRARQKEREASSVASMLDGAQFWLGAMGPVMATMSAPKAEA